MTIRSALLANRISEARGRAGLTQVQLAAQAGLDRSALAKIESNGRGVSALELARIAQALETRIEWLLEDGPPTLVSHRNMQAPGVADAVIDTTVERLARNVDFVIEHDGSFLLGQAKHYEVPQSAREAELLADETRKLLQADDTSPLTELGEALALVGMQCFSLELGGESADAASVLLSSGAVALVNGTLRTGRRRLALAHEVAHVLVADDFTVDWRVAEHVDSNQRESLFDRFARALLLPEIGVRQRWEALTHNQDRRTAVVRLGSEFRVDMATLARRLLELGVVDGGGAAAIRSVRTTRSDIVELGLVVGDELAAPYLPQRYERAVLNLFRGEVIGSDRALDLLLNVWEEDQLPTLPHLSEDAMWQFV